MHWYVVNSNFGMNWVLYDEIISQFYKTHIVNDSAILLIIFQVRLEIAHKNYVWELKNQLRFSFWQLAL